MNLESIILTKLRAMQKPILPSGKGYIMTTCLNPSHEDRHPSFWVSLEDGRGSCFSCRYSVNVDYWIKDSIDEEQIYEIQRNIIYNNILEYFEDKKQDSRHSIYLPPFSGLVQENWRGLTKETIQKYNIYVCKEGKFSNRVIFPFHNIHGQLCGYVGRSIDNSVTPKYLYSKGLKTKEIIYPDIPNNTNYIVITEGILDALTMQQVGIPAIMNFGVQYTFSQEKMNHILQKGVETIYVALDNDEAGREGFKKYLNSPLKEFFQIKHGALCSDLIEFYKSGEKDFNDFYIKHLHTHTSLDHQEAI